MTNYMLHQNQLLQKINVDTDGRLAFTALVLEKHFSIIQVNLTLGKYLAKGKEFMKKYYKRKKLLQYMEHKMLIKEVLQNKRGRSILF